MSAQTTIDDPEAYFQTVIWTGNGTDGRTITLPGSTDMQPDFIWVKNRSDGEDHCLMDSARTFASGKALRSNGSDEEGGVGTAARGWVEATSDGFTCEDGSSSANLVNASSDTYVAWCWKESATSGFDIVTYTGTGSAHTISHSLSAKPGLLWVKYRSGVANWQVWHKSLPDTGDKVLYLNTTHGQQDEIMFNDTEPTSSVFSVGAASETNTDDGTYVAYLWAEKQGFSKFGSYLGNGNANGTYVYTGFRPAFVLVKRTNTSGGNWWIWDNKRLGYNAANDNQYADLNNAEDTSGRGINLLSNGFKCISTDNGSNGSGNTYVYAAFAHSPFVNSSGVPNNPR